MSRHWQRDQLGNAVRFDIWRVSAEQGVKHRNPLINESLGVTLDTIAIDSLHCVNLGVMKEYVTHVFWELLDSNAFEVDPERTLNERHVLGVHCLRHELFQWYDVRRQENPDEPIYAMKALTVKMLGKRTTPKLRAKAAEMKFLLFFFATEMCERYKDKLTQGEALHGAGQSLVKYMKVCAENGRNLSNRAYQDDISAWFLVFRST